MLLWPTLGYGPIALDDASLLREFSSAPLAQVLGYDHFGHCELQEASLLLEESRSLAPEDPALIGNQFEVLWRLRRAADALVLLDAHSEVLRGAEYEYRRAKLLEMLGKHEAALSAYQSLANGTENRQVRFDAGYSLATLLVAKGRLGEAKGVLERMLSEFPQDPQLTLAHQLITSQAED